MIFVDDVMILGKKHEAARLFKMLGELFELREMGDVNSLLSLEVIRDKKMKSIVISQRKYTQKIVEAAGQAVFTRLW